MTGIYVHIPFCKRKCKYCDFISFDNCDKNVMTKYVENVKKEIQNCKINRKIDTIYIGGGTPSIIDEDAIADILEEIYKKFEISENAEVTIEVNPGTTSLEKLKTYKKSGINRLSIGLQSTNDRLLELIGRIHKYEDFEKVYRDARNVGFNNINVDLMLGLPTQTLQELMESLEKVTKLNAEHISVYSLILEDDTEMARLVAENKLKMPEDELERQMYWSVKKKLQEKGYEHYEISNFAKKGYESKHNLACWEQEEYIGFGLASHSYVDKTRFCKIRDLEKYFENPDDIIVQEKQNFEMQAKEYMMLGFRKIQGISISKFERKFAVNPLFYFRFEISKMVENGLIEVDLDDIRLTNKGIDFANIVFEEFV